MIRASIVAALAAFTVGACSTWQTSESPLPSTYDAMETPIPRTVGRLRTLLWLPATRALPVECRGTAQQDDWRLADDEAPVSGGTIDWAMKSFERRGYELVTRASRTTDTPAAIDWAATLTALRIAAESSPSAQLSPEASAAVTGVGTAARVDGIALFLYADTCQRGSKAMHQANWVMENVLQFGLPHLFGPTADSLAPQQEALVAIFETRRGRLAWRSYRYAEVTIRGSALVPDLFHSLETAVPAVLTR